MGGQFFNKKVKSVSNYLTADVVLSCSSLGLSSRDCWLPIRFGKQRRLEEYGGFEECVAVEIEQDVEAETMEEVIKSPLKGVLRMENLE